MYSTHECLLDLPSLPKAARHAYIMPDLQNGTLLSVGQMCDAGCLAYFDKSSAEIWYNQQLVLLGTRSGPNGLWYLVPPNEQPSLQEANAARPSFLPASTKPADIVAFMHAALGSPVLSTLRKAIDNGYIHGFPGLTSRTIRNHPPFSVATVKGHQDHIRKNVQSTSKPTKPNKPSYAEAANKPPPVETVNDDDAETFTDAFPSSDSPNERTHFCYLGIEEITGQIYSDQTGKFTIPSSNGNKYVMVVYDYDSNCIFAEPLVSRKATSILAAFKRVLIKLKAAGLKPKFQRLDNECSKILKDFLTQEGIDFQLAPPNSHRRNAAERAIRTFKNHFIAILMGADKDFPLHL